MEKLKNKTVFIFANSFGALFIRVYEDEEQTKEIGTYKFDGHINCADLEIGIPEGKRKKYAKIIKAK